jgi:ferredoxin
MLHIDPDSCLDCDACRMVCPVDAIFYEGDVPEKWKDFIRLNEDMAAKTPSITQRKTPLAER